MNVSDRRQILAFMFPLILIITSSFLNSGNIKNCPEQRHPMKSLSHACTCIHSQSVSQKNGRMDRQMKVLPWRIVVSRTPLVFCVGSEHSTAEAAVSQTPDFTLDQCHGPFVTSLTHTPARTRGGKGHTRRRAGAARTHASGCTEGWQQTAEAPPERAVRACCCTVPQLQPCKDTSVCMCVWGQLLLLLASPPIISSSSPPINSSSPANFFLLPSCHSPSSLPSEPPVVC